MASLVAVSILSFAIIYIGLPVVPGVDLAWLANLSSIGLMVLWVAFVVPFASRFKPNKWYAHGFWVLVLVVLSSPVPALVIRTFLFQPFSIPSGSMVPTL
ncbi:hypothetical protein ACWTU9_33300, partial [Mesorhizobium sp. 128a]